MTADPLAVNFDVLVSENMCRIVKVSLIAVDLLQTVPLEELNNSLGFTPIQLTLQAQVPHTL